MTPTGTQHQPTRILQNGLKTEVSNLPSRSQKAARKISVDALNEIKDYFPSAAIEYLGENFLENFSENWQQTIISACLNTIFEVFKCFNTKNKII